MTTAENTKRFREKHKVLGLCCHCDSPVAHGQYRCQRHFDELMEMQRKRRERHKTLGVCCHCSSPVTRGLTLCQRHFDEKMENQRMYRETEKGRLAERNASNKSRRKCKYGLPEEQYEQLLESQKGKCKICGQENVNGRPLGVDHNHTTGVVRGLLCHKCNTAIGMLNDSPSLLENAITYLKGEQNGKI